MNYKFLSIVALLSFSMWLDLISILTYVGYVLKLSAIDVALVSIAMLLPQAFLGKLLSKIVKKFDTQQVFVWSTIGRIICTIALVWIDTIYALIIVLLIRSFFLGLLQPIIASQAKEMAKTQGGRFSSILNLINSLSKIAAPSIGGVISVILSEHYVFIISGLASLVALILILANPLTNSKSENKLLEGGSTISKNTLIPFSIAILFISGLSAMFTNLIPYVFHFYSIPKLTLSIAISASAIAGLLFNLFIIKKNPSISSFPIMHFFNAWCTSAIFCAGLTISMLTGSLSVILIPLTFAAISIARVYFEVFSNSYIYNHESSEAITLSTFKQSLTSLAGIVATIFGAIGVTYVQPYYVLLAMSAISGISCIIWLMVFSRKKTNAKRELESVKSN